jgi:putative heme-binding domain-containing protein
MRWATAGIACFGLFLLTGRAAAQADGPRRDPYSGFIAPTGPRSPEDERKGFHLPPGFEIQLVAAEPVIRKPLNLAFDDRGRLWVTETIEYPHPAPPDRTPRDAVKILEDTDSDGKADKVTTFADGLNIPIGVLPIQGGALVYSIPHVYRLLDTDGDDKADRREVLYSKFGSDDTHGMISSLTWGFDGWVYAGHGFRNTSTVRGADGSSITMQSGNTFRMKPDGSRVEQFTFGQVNPFGLAFDPLGNLYSADCHTRPVMMLLRSGYYESFGKPHDGLGFAPEMCSHNHGSTAISGLVYYAADHFPPAYRDTIFIGNVVTNRINHDRLERRGSTLQAVLQPDFLTSDDPWFRPVDLKLGPDGALYVADFYNRIIGHYEVPLNHPGRDRDRGRIWRIVYRGPDGKGAPARPRDDWAKATIPELLQDLAHANMAVRVKAANQLVQRGGQPVAAAVHGVLQPTSQPSQRIHGLWVLERLNALDEPTLTTAAKDPDAGVRVHAMRILAERTQLTEPLHKLVLAGLQDPDAFVQRAAADALGTHPRPENVRPLLDVRHTVPAEDRQLLHTVRMALRNQLRPEQSWARLPAPLGSEADTRAVADVAAGVPSAEAAGFLLAHLQRLPEEQENLRRFARHVARYGSDQTAQALLAFARGDRPGELRHQAALFKAIQQGTQERGGRPGDGVKNWGEELGRKLLGAGTTDLVVAGAELAGALKLETLQPDLVALATRKEAADPQRRAAVQALVAINPREQMALLGRLLEDTAEPLPLRDQLAGILAGLNHTEARDTLLKNLPTAPARLQNAIAAGLAGTQAGAEKLLEAVAAGKASARLLQERVVRLRLAQANLPALDERLAQLTLGLPSADQGLLRLLQRRRQGFLAAKTDPRLGAKVYEKSCAACHQLGGMGAKVGPQLDGIGTRGLERLLEDVLDPNRNVDQAFRSTTVALTNGQVVSGLVLREEGEVVVLADVQGKEVRISKGMIQERTVSPLSPMPANLVEQVPESDFHHLMAYLLAQRPPH